MKNSQLALILSAVYVSPYTPDISNLVCGGLMFILGLYYLFKNS